MYRRIGSSGRASNTQIFYIQSLLHQFPTDYVDDSKKKRERHALDEAMADMPRIVGKVNPIKRNAFKRVSRAQASTIIDRLNLML